MIQYKIKKFILLPLINLYFIFQNLYIFYLKINFLYKNENFYTKKKLKKKKNFFFHLLSKLLFKLCLISTYDVIISIYISLEIIKICNIKLYLIINYILEFYLFQ